MCCFSSGNGDIVPKTFEGKIFTIAYATIGIPIFMWYIFKLGVLFRHLFMKAFYYIVGKVLREYRDMDLAGSANSCLRRCMSSNDEENGDGAENNSSTRRDNFVLTVDKRFHPVVIGKIVRSMHVNRIFLRE